MNGWGHYLGRSKEEKEEEEEEEEQ